MKSTTFGEVDFNDFEQVYLYICHIIGTKHNLSKIIFSPEGYMNAQKYEIFQNNHYWKNQTKRKLYVPKMKNGKSYIEIIITCVTDGTICIY